MMNKTNNPSCRPGYKSLLWGITGFALMPLAAMANTASAQPAQKAGSTVTCQYATEEQARTLMARLITLCRGET